MMSTESILSISFTSSLARFGGDVAVGAMTVLNSINQLISMPLAGICQGGQPLISYNYGAKKLERVKEAFFCQFGACVAYTTVFWVLLPPKVKELITPRIRQGVSDKRWKPLIDLSIFSPYGHVCVRLEWSSERGNVKTFSYEARVIVEV